MSNFDMFVDYAVKSVTTTSKIAVIGLIGSDLTRKQVKQAVRKVAKKSGVAFDADITELAVYFNIKETV